VNPSASSSVRSRQLAASFAPSSDFLFAACLANTPAPPSVFQPSALIPCRTCSSGSIWPSMASMRAGPSPLSSASRVLLALPVLGSPEPTPRPPRCAVCTWPGWARCDVRMVRLRSTVTTPRGGRGRGGGVCSSAGHAPTWGIGGRGPRSMTSPLAAGPVLMGTEGGRVLSSRSP
jgi:hypothetical protein